MPLLRYFLLLGLFLLSQLGRTQTPFTATWNFEGNANGSSSSGLVTASAATPTGVNYLTVNPYTTGYAGLGVNVQNWSTAVCNNSEYVEITVQPVTGAVITLTSLSFAFARSASGPQQLSVRSSADGFSTDLFTSGVNQTYQVGTISLSATGFINQASPVTFRIYACNPTAGGGTLRLDEIKVNASVLPVELLYFRAQFINDRVELAWATVWERNAERFVIERSRDLLEFGALGSVSASGTTDQTQQYTFTDPFPDGGTAYYRLKQLDYDGGATYSKPVAVIIDDHAPSLVILGNPSDASVIRVAGRNLAAGAFSLITSAGVIIPLEVQSMTDGSLQLLSSQKPPVGLYWLITDQPIGRLVHRIFLR